MSTISELRSEAQSRGEELVKRFQELEKAEKQILLEKQQIKTQKPLLKRLKTKKQAGGKSNEMSQIFY